MTSEAHLEIYNPTYNYEHGEFSLFPLLPKELRQLIWRLSLHRHRIIKIKIPERPWRVEVKTKEEFYAGVKKEYPIVPGHHVFSKLLRVNSESRDVALRFYRVHMHCNLKRGGIVKPGTLMFNPEFDIIQIKPGPWTNRFAKLLRDLKTSDPKGVGILRLALDLNGVNSIQGNTDLAAMDSLTREAFIATIAQLEEVYFVVSGFSGRMWEPTGTETVTMMGKLEFHRSAPIAPKIPSFDLIARDPRPIASDLRAVYAGHSDSRRLVFIWRKMLDLWGIPQPPLSNYRFIVSVQRVSCKRVKDRAHAEWWLRQEDKFWTGLLDEVDTNHTSPGSRIRALLEKLRGDYDLERAPSPKNVVGFWIFPVEAMGPMPSNEEEHHAMDNNTTEWKKVLDMSDYWPALGLSYLP
ncbi:hypothetical protein F4781DRAFT_411506 [Annulohypoxylon bovei var. microspora]|nr:hypothetical protein F4781DRAFT_411506 [Annulohypoxylon bovei var. microspora]